MRFLFGVFSIASYLLLPTTTYAQKQLIPQPQVLHIHDSGHFRLKDQNINFEIQSFDNEGQYLIHAYRSLVSKNAGVSKSSGNNIIKLQQIQKGNGTLPIDYYEIKFQ